MLGQRGESLLDRAGGGGRGVKLAWGRLLGESWQSKGPA